MAGRWKIGFAVVVAVIPEAGRVYLNDPENLDLQKPDWLNKAALWL